MNSEYHPSSELTRIIPLGAEFGRYELAVERLRQIGLFPSTDVADFWLSEIRHWRDGAALPEGREPISPWIGQFLTSLARLNYRNTCICAVRCNSGGCELCRRRVDDLIERLTEHSRGPLAEFPPPLSSRYFYEEAIDFLANTGAISSPEYWKGERFRTNPEFRRFIRVSALSVSTSSPRRGDSGSSNAAINWLDRDGFINDGDSGFWEDEARPQPARPPQPEPDPEDETETESESEEYEEEEVMNINAMFSRIVDDAGVEAWISPWVNNLLVNLSRLNFRERGRDIISGYRAEIDWSINNMELYYEAVDSLANSGALHSPGYWKGLNMSRHTSVRHLIRLADRLVDPIYPTRMSAVQALMHFANLGIIWRSGETHLNTVNFRNFIDFWWVIQLEWHEDWRLSPWLPELLIDMSSLNYDTNLIQRYAWDHRWQLATFSLPQLEDLGAYDDAIDSLSNTGVISSPEYWKEPERRNDPNLRMLVRLADLTVDYNNPISNFPKPRVTIEQINHGRNWLPTETGNLEGNIVEGVVIWDDVTEPWDLRRRADEWIRNHRSITNSITISALDLSRLDNVLYDDFKVGDSYLVDNRLLGADTNEEGYQLIQNKIDIVNPLKSVLTFGDRQIMMSSSR